MADIRPFRGYRPRPDCIELIASPPYDVLDSDEAREMARGNRLSFLHVSKPEIDLPPETDPYADIVYRTGAENLQKLIAGGYLQRDPEPCFYLYQQRMGEHTQIGVMAAASVAEYENNLIKKHEHTRRAKEDDRTRHTDALNANAGPVFLTYRARPEIDALVARARQNAPANDFIAADGIGHALWPIDDPATIKALRAAFAQVPALYVADGHHRAASAARIGAERRARNPRHTGREPYNHFLAVLFPDDQLRILDYNRVVKDLRGRSPEAFIQALEAKFTVEPGTADKPAQPRTFGMYLAGRWQRLTAKPGTFPPDDPVRSLDVQILYENALAPLLGITDPRTDERIDFVGGIRGTRELQRLVDEGKYAVAFAMHPTTIAQLLAIADAGQVMPPKSTWFEPKLRSGIVVRTLAED